MGNKFTKKLEKLRIFNLDVNVDNHFSDIASLLEGREGFDFSFVLGGDCVQVVFAAHL